MHDPALRRRRFAYPIITLCVAGLIWLMSTGRISAEPQVEPEVYEKFVTEVIRSAREGQGPLVDGGDAQNGEFGAVIVKAWKTIAPAGLSSKDGGDFRVRYVSLEDLSEELNDDVVRDALAGVPVEVRLMEGPARGQGAYVYVKFVDGAARIVGVGAVAPASEAGMDAGTKTSSELPDAASTDGTGVR